MDAAAGAELVPLAGAPLVLAGLTVLLDAAELAGADEAGTVVLVVMVVTPEAGADEAGAEAGADSEALV